MYKKSLGHKQTYYVLNKEEVKHRLLSNSFIDKDWKRDNILTLVNGEMSEDSEYYVSAFLSMVRFFSSVSKIIEPIGEFEEYKSVIMEKIEELLEPRIKEYYERERRFMTGTEAWRARTSLKI
jgi:hypothetical protein